MQYALPADMMRTMRQNWKHSTDTHFLQRRAGPSEKSNRFRGTKSTLTSCRDRTPKGRSLSKIKQISWHEIDTHVLQRLHTEGEVPQQNQKYFVARNQHSLPAKIAHQRAGPSAKSNRFRGTKSTLTSCRDRTPKSRSLSEIKQISWHEIDTHVL